MSVKFSISCFSSLVAFSVLTSPFVHSQEIPNSLQPDVIDRQFDQLPDATSSSAILIPTPSEQLPPDVASDTSLLLNSVSLEGNNEFSTAELSQYYQSYIGENVSLATFFAVANAITDHYAQAGFALSLAYVPAQEIDNGHVRLVVVEGYVGEIDYTGDVDKVTDRLRSVLSPILNERPLTVATMERALLLASRETGFGVASSVDRSSIEVGALRLIVDVENELVSGAVGINNRGSRALGAVLADVSVSLNGAFGVGERITTSLNKSVADDELSYFSLEAAFPIGVNGTELSIGYGKSDAKPGLETLRLLEFNADSETYFVELYHPFILSRARNLNASVRFEARDSEGELLDIVNTNEKLRSLRISGSYDMVDDAGAVTLVKTTFSQGISAFGGSANDNEFKARDLARYDYSKIDVLFFQLRPINETLSVYLSGGAQYGFNPLVSSEQCGFGGGSFGRAFDSFEISGDHCVNASVELRSMYPNPMKGVDYIQPYGFVDGGKVWLKQAEGVSSISQTGYSAGAGMRAMFLNNVSGYVEVALPINRDVEQAGNRKARVFAGLRAIF